jgi:hypothetical protein
MGRMANPIMAGDELADQIAQRVMDRMAVIGAKDAQKK